MSELTDDQLDGLFRKSAEEFDPPFDPAAWQDMKTRLDTNDRIVPGGTPIWKNLLRWGIGGVVLLLLLGGVWFSYQQAIRSAVGSRLVPVGSDPQTNVSTTTQSQRAPAIGLGNIGSAQKTPADSPKDQSERNEQLSKASRPAVSAEANGEHDAPDPRPDRAIARVTEPTMPNAERIANVSLPAGGVAAEVKTERNPSARSGVVTPTAVKRDNRIKLTRTDRKNGTRLSTRKQVKTRQSGRETGYSSIKYNVSAASMFSGKPVQTKLESERVAEGRIANTIPVLEAEKAGPVSLPTLSELIIRPARWPVALAFAGRDVVAQPDTITHKSVPKQAVMRGLSVRLAVAPDLSAIGLKNFTRPGTNVGILLEYRLASRWSVQAGVIQSTKIYTARNSEYELPSYTTNWKVRPEGVDGQCNMLDIPINVRYDVVLRPRPDGRPPSRWFVSGGVTSYIIEQEDYTYTYADPNNPHIYSNMLGWTSKDKDVASNFGFSQLNLSAGYERAISKRLSWQVEPFLKAPLRGVGYLKINLLSTGAFFSIRYKL